MSKPPKKSLAVLADEVAYAINGLGDPYPKPWPHRFRVIEPALGAKVVVTETPELVIGEVSIQHVADCIVSWLGSQGVPEWFVTADQAMAIAKTWRAGAVPIPLPSIKSVRWANENGHTWHRLVWPLQRGDAPTWDRLLARMSNNQAFIAWIGSLFFEQSDMQQYCYLYGTGGDGKGSINRFLERVFGKAYVSKQPMGAKGQSDKFWTYGLIGARLVAFPDCDDPSFVSRGLFKSLTGGDAVAVEIKGGMAFTARMNAKYLVISNDPPSINFGSADTRRIIYCSMEKNGEYDPAFEQMLWDEGGAFLTYCVETYFAAHPDFGPIKSDLSELADWVSTSEEPFEEVFEKWFRMDTMGMVVPSEMQRVLKDEYRHRTQQLQFMKWLDRTHGIRKKTVRLMEGVNQKRYGGIMLKKQPPTLAYSNVRDGGRDEF